MPYFRGHGGATSAISQENVQPTITLTYPSGVQADDVLILLVPRGIYLTELPAWTAHGQTVTVDGVPGSQMFTKTADGSESGTIGPLDGSISISPTRDRAIAGIIFCYEGHPDAGPGFWNGDGPNSGSFGALTGEDADVQIVVAYAFSSTQTTPGGPSPSVVYDADLTVDARVPHTTPTYDGFLAGTNDGQDFYEFSVGSRAITDGTVPQLDMSSTDEFDAFFWRSRNAGFLEGGIVESYVGMLGGPL
jgi:hypothetical protein